MGHQDFCSYFCGCGWIKGQMDERPGLGGSTCCPPDGCRARAGLLTRADGRCVTESLPKKLGG